MQKSRIEWTDYTLNPIKGMCPVDCKDNQGKSYCYARRMYKRFKWNPEIRFQPGEFLSLPSKPSKVFVGSTIELFGDWIDTEWMDLIFEAVKVRPQHTFIFLTKQPQNLIKWSPFPDNCWMGVSAVDKLNFYAACHYQAQIIASVKFISLEPLQESLGGCAPIEEHFTNAGVSWVIIGQQTPVKKATMPKIEWIEEIVEACDKASIPVFLKDNLKSVLPAHAPFVTNPLRDMEFGLRQEFPVDPLDLPPGDRIDPEYIPF